jgi:putative ABC transport system ATP-binding protein
MENKQIILRTNDLSKSYKVGGSVIRALKGVTITLKQGEFVAITGESGSGKSTLLQLLGCLDKPTSGQVFVNDKDTSRLSDARLSDLRREMIGFVFQSFYLQPFLRLEDNIAVPAMFTHKKKKAIEAQVEELLKQVGLAERKKHYPKELSGGQIQRAAIARALINNPQLILADEPTGNLDSQNSASIISLFQTIRAQFNTTIVVVTHNQEIAAQADRVIQLKDGSIL